jgi:hypothetical protein
MSSSAITLTVTVDASRGQNQNVMRCIPGALTIFAAGVNDPVPVARARCQL